MRCLLVVALLFAVAYAQHNSFDHLIYNEVHAIIAANPKISIADCSTKCDSMFDLIDGHDETHTDKVCQQACDCEINKTCAHHHTQPAHHTHPTHPTHHHQG